MSDFKTPLYNQHIKNSGKMVSFAGWQMPVQYKNGLKAEHLHTRRGVGLFDVSHMGEIRVFGEKSLETLEWVTTNHVASLKKGQAHYSLFPNSQGGIVDDLIVYCLEPGQDYLLCVNAANIQKDFEYINANNQGAEVVNESSQWGQIAIQGPEAMALINEVLGVSPEQCPSFHFVPFRFLGQTCYFARTGYTGEDGGEVFVPWDTTEALWLALAEGRQNVWPIGLGARDTLRMEMKYSLYGQEIDDETSPYEALLGWVVKPQLKDFLGKDVMVRQKEQGLSRKLVGIEVQGRGIARTGYKTFSFDNKEIGKVTSGTLSPSVEKAIAIGYVEKEYGVPGTQIYVEIRNKRVEAQVVKTPFK